MNTHELAYFAGLMDGEGTFTVYKTVDARTKVYNALISISLTSEEGIAWIVQRLGGNTYRPEMHGNREAQTQWQLRDKGLLIELLRELIPFLVFKQIHARLLLKYCVEFQNARRGKKVSDEDIEIREAYCTIFSDLNSRGVGSTNKKKSVLAIIAQDDSVLPVIQGLH